MQIEQDFFIRLEDTGTGFRLSNKGLITMLTNLACIHGNRIGQGLMDREKCGLSWMVVGWRIEVLHRPTLAETIHGVTWAQESGKIQTSRDFLLYDPQGRVAARATSAWLVLDEHNTKVQRITPQIIGPYEAEPERKNFPGYAFPREVPDFEPERTVELRVGKAMIDCNEHVHNIAYLDIADEALPEDVDMEGFNDVTIVYRREIKPRELVRVSYGRTPEGHAVIIREADSDLVHAFLLLQ